METKTRFDFFETGDRTALVCVDDPELHNATVEQLTAAGYKIHTGLFAEDISLKMKSHTYDVVVVFEHFNEADLETNPVLAEIRATEAAQRRNQFVILLGPSMITDDQMQAFRLSVDLTVGIANLQELRAVLGRALIRHTQFYRTFKECATMAGMM